MLRAGLFANPGPLRTAAAAGLERLGFRVVYQIPGAWEANQAERGLDAVVVCGLRDRCGEVVTHYQAQKVPIALVDLPHWRAMGPEKHHRVSPPSHFWLPEFDNGAPPLDRYEQLGIELQQRRRVKGQAVLLCGQRSGDTAHGMAGGELRRWVARTVETLRAVTDSKIIWRPHPKDVFRVEGVDAYSDPETEDLSEAFDRSWVVVVYNSTAGLEALVSGLPVIAEGSAVYGHLTVKLNQFSRAGAPDPVALQDLLARIAYTQWTTEEIAEGLPLDVALRDRVLPGRTELEEAGKSGFGEQAPPPPGTLPSDTATVVEPSETEQAEEALEEAP